MMAGLLVCAVFTFLAVIMATKIIIGEERIIYYHHEIAVMLVSALVLWLLDQPLLLYLDITILGIGIFLACGRIGCLMVGCCHGKPHRWGVCYRDDHASAGFTPYYVGVRLFPVQLMESLWVLVIVVIGSALILSNKQPGEALAWYVIAYDLGRFCFEFLRGDPERSYYLGFSQPQWISLILMLLVVGAEFAGILPFQTSHIGATGLLVMTMISVALWRRFGIVSKHQLLHPRHVKEVAEAIELVSNIAIEANAISPKEEFLPRTIHLACTSNGVNLSTGRIKNAAGHIQLYTLSSRHELMTETVARILADLILLLKHAASSHELVKGNRGVFHLLVHTGRA
ncbi:MAG: prolipoprotein diacylglyceryl transferase [Acidobacteria bacterium]|nr:prolipoprotein diacylglyceryl transferase [Acidobacteriota bacterium]